MAENKTKPTDVSVDAFLDAVPDPVRRADGKALAAMIERVSGMKPVMWGPTIVGYGRTRYRTDAGREGDMPIMGFSPRKAELVVYATASAPERPALLEKLGKHRLGKGCLYIRKLADVDTGVLEALIRASLAHKGALPQP